MAHIGLELRAGNQAAHDFYRAMGFVEVSWVNHYYREHEAALRMRYVLRHDSSELPLWQPPSSN